MLELVQNGKFIGTMSDSGHVVIVDGYKRKDYNFYSEPAPEPVKVKVEEPVEVDPTTEVLDVSEGYSQYTKVVDGFFRGLSELWAEIDSGIEA